MNFFWYIVSSFGDKLFFLEAPCMETILVDFYFASIHCLWIMNKNSVKKNAWNFQDEKFGTFSSEILLILLLISSQILLSKTWSELIISAERAIAFNETALRHLLPDCIAPRATRGCHTVEPFLMQHLKVWLWHLNFKLGRILKWREMVVTKDYRIIETKQNSTIAQLSGI